MSDGGGAPLVFGQSGPSLPAPFSALLDTVCHYSSYAIMSLRMIETMKLLEAPGEDIGRPALPFWLAGCVCVCGSVKCWSVSAICPVV